MMTSREIIFANLKQNVSARPGLNFDRDRCNDLVGGGPGFPKGYQPRRWVEGAYEYYDDIWGNIWHRMAAEGACKGGEIYRPVIAEWEDFVDFKLPVYDRSEVADNYRKGFEQFPDRFRLAGLPGWIFAQARYLRKLDNYLMDMVLYPEELHRLHNMLAEVFEVLILAAGDAGADALVFCEDMGTQNDLLFSPEMWNEFFRELYTRLFALAHERGIHIFMHSCGQNRKILEPLLQAGVDCFQFDQPAIYNFTDLSALLRKYQSCLWSPVDIQQVLPTGNRQKIEAEVERMVEAFRGMLIFKNYGDLNGIGVRQEWDNWAYNKILEVCGLPEHGQVIRQ